MKCEKARQTAENPGRLCWMVKAGEEQVLSITEKPLEKAERKQTSKNNERNTSLEKGYEEVGIWSLKASEEVPELRCALELLQKLAEMYNLSPPFQKLRFRGSGMGLGILTYEIPWWDRWRLCVEQTSRTAGLETPATFSYQCHSTLVTYLERMGIFFPDARHKHVGLNKPVSALVRRLVGRGIH